MAELWTNTIVHCGLADGFGQAKNWTSLSLAGISKNDRRIRAIAVWQLLPKPPVGQDKEGSALSVSLKHAGVNLGEDLCKQRTNQTQACSQQRKKDRSITTFLDVSCFVLFVGFFLSLFCSFAEIARINHKRYAEQCC